MRHSLIIFDGHLFTMGGRELSWPQDWERSAATGRNIIQAQIAEITRLQEINNLYLRRIDALICCIEKIPDKTPEIIAELNAAILDVDLERRGDRVGDQGEPERNGKESV